MILSQDVGRQLPLTINYRGGIAVSTSIGTTIPNDTSNEFPTYEHQAIAVIALLIFMRVQLLALLGSATNCCVTQFGHSLVSHANKPVSWRRARFELSDFVDRDV